MQLLSNIKNPFVKSVWHILENWCWVIMAAAAAAVLWIWALTGCSMTVAPKPVVAAEVRFDQNAQNAGVIDCDAKGCIVTPGWMGRYRALEKTFNQAIPADDQIAVEGSNYRVSYEVSNNFAVMRASERGP